MAVPTLTTDLTQLDACDSVTGWSSWGVGNKLAVDPDINLEGTNCVGLPVKFTGDGGYGPTGFTAISLSANLLLLWVYIAEVGFLNTGATPGLYIRVGSSGNFTSNYNDYNIGGNDVEWCTGGWRPVVLDANRTADTTIGSPNLGSINAIGLGGDYTATSSKASVTAVDNICYGTYVEATGVASSSSAHSFTSGTNTITRSSGSFTTDGFEVGDEIVIAGTASNNGEYTLATVGTTTMTTTGGITTEGSVTSSIDAYITFEDIYAKDNNTTDDTWYASVTKNRDGVYEINYDLRIGDQSGAVNTYFRSRNEQALFADQPLNTGTSQTLRLKTYEDTGTTKFEFGNSSGTGDSRVGFAGTTVSETDTEFDQDALIDLSNTITTCDVFGSTFLGIGSGLDFATSTSHHVTNTTFASCGPIDIGSVEARNLTFSGYSGTDGALNWNGSIDIKNSSFLANLNSSGTSHAIYHDTQGTYTYNNLSFSGNDYDIENPLNSTSEDVYAGSDDAAQAIGNGTITAAGTSWTSSASAGTLTKVQFRLRTNGSPSGNAVAKLYAHTGTYGTDGTPTGSVLATSENVDVTSLTGSYADTAFEFNDKYALSNSTYYFIVVEFTGDASNYIEMALDNTAPGHDGNYATYTSSWSSDNSVDPDFEVWSDGYIEINATNGADPATYENTGSPSGVTWINNAVSFEVRRVTYNARCRIENASDSSIVYLSDYATTVDADNTGFYKATASINDPGAVSVNVIVRQVGYLPYLASSSKGSSENLIVTPVWQTDTIADKTDMTS
jgi:hypothetical protein